MVTGTRLKELREERDITLVDAANAIGLLATSLDLVEQGTRLLTTFEVIKLCRYYSVSLSEVLFPDDCLYSQDVMIDEFLQGNISEEELAYFLQKDSGEFCKLISECRS